MANTKSAEKQARVSRRKNTSNSKTKAGVRTIEKKLRAAIAKKDKVTAESLLLAFTSQIGKAAQKGVVHFKAASRKISRLSRQFTALGK